MPQTILQDLFEEGFSKLKSENVKKTRQIRGLPLPKTPQLRLQAKFALLNIQEQ